jgi:hypothetical protein
VRGVAASNDEPLGKKITVAGAEVEVIGVMKRPAAPFHGQNDSRIMLPYFTMHKLFPSAEVDRRRGSAHPAAAPECSDRHADPRALIDKTVTVYCRDRGAESRRPPKSARGHSSPYSPKSALSWVQGIVKNEVHYVGKGRLDLQPAGSWW